MKIQKNSTYDALFISDFHYLINKKIKTHYHKDLFKMFDFFDTQNIRFRKIYLVGDIIESWYFNSSKKLKKGRKRFNKLFERIDKVAKDQNQKFFIIGNHDTTRFDARLSDRLQGYLNERNWNIRTVIYEKNYIVAHGHQGQYGLLFWFFSIFIVRLTYQFARMFPALMRTAEKYYRKYLNFDRHSTAEQQMKFYVKLGERLQRKNELIICGHTHQYLIDPELKIANCGDWVESRTFLIKSGKSLHGLRYEQNNRFTLLNSSVLF